jgi:excisionase family DNA binding protein
MTSTHRTERATETRRRDCPIRPLDGPLLTPAEAAALLSVKTSWIYEAARSGRLPCLRIGRHIRFTQEMLEKWLEAPQ